MRNRILGRAIALATGALLTFSGAVVAAKGLPVATGGRLARLQKELRLPQGNADYLGAYRALVARRRAIFVAGKAPANLNAAMRRVVNDKQAAAEIRRIVRDIAITGAPPDLLRNTLLKRTNIDLNKAGPYGTVFGRLGIMLNLQYLAARSAKDGHPRRAARYARTALFLVNQDDFNGMGLLLAGNEPLIANAGVPGLASWFAGRHARLQRAYTAWWVVLKRFDTAFAKAEQPGGRKSVGAMRTAFNAAAATADGHIHWQLMLAIDARDHRAQLSGLGMLSASRALRGWLSGWAKRVRHGPAMQGVERTAVLNWIKEAIGP